MLVATMGLAAKTISRVFFPVWMAALALLPAGCRSISPEKLKRSDTGRIKHEVREMAESISSDVAKDGPNAWLRYFADTPGFFMAVNGKLQFAEFSQMKAALPEFSAGIAHMELAWSNLKVDPVSKHAAMMAADYAETFIPKAGTNLEFHGYFSGLAVETGSGWKLRDAHWSMLPAAP